MRKYAHTSCHETLLILRYLTCTQNAYAVHLSFYNNTISNTKRQLINNNKKKKVIIITIKKRRNVQAVLLRTIPNQTKAFFFLSPFFFVFIYRQASVIRRRNEFDINFDANKKMFYVFFFFYDTGLKILLKYIVIYITFTLYTRSSILHRKKKKYNLLLKNKK